MITNQVTVIKKDMAQTAVPAISLLHSPSFPVLSSAGATTGHILRFGVQLSKYDC